jgi:hypothetical protein
MLGAIELTGGPGSIARLDARDSLLADPYSFSAVTITRNACPNWLTVGVYVASVAVGIAEHLRLTQLSHS